ncbi:MAG: fasciclin domain-containing protein [Bacteroidetes bacterium]|nr:fasciclin domain-containing protein [Bacteroidota bacterium]
MKNFKLVTFALLGFAAISLVGCNAPKEEATDETLVDSTTLVEEVSNTVVDIAVKSADHTTLVAAVTAAGLVETLSGPGPFTIFAPTNAAFAALPAGTVEGLLKPESKDKLTSILTYHVVAGNIMSPQLSDGQKVKTLNGQELTVAIKGGVVTINGIKVVAPDLAGSNGVIHVVEGVIMPK